MTNSDAEREHIEAFQEELDERVISKHDDIVGQLLLKMDNCDGPCTVSHVEFVKPDDVEITQQAMMMTKRFFASSGSRTRVDFFSSSNGDGKLQQSFLIEVDADPAMLNGPSSS